MALDPNSIHSRSATTIQALSAWIGPILDTYFMAEVRGLERVPEGAGLYVGNHNGGICSADSFIFANHLLERLGVDAVPYGLGHDLAVDIPILKHILVPLGAVRASSQMAHRIFSEGMKVLVYPGGDVDSLRCYRDRDRIMFDGRKGYLRLALREGVPIIPVVAAGAHATFVVLDDGRWLAQALGLDRWFRIKVWPITLALPWGLMVGTIPYFPLPTKILIEVLEPLHFERSGPEAAEDDEYVRACDAQVQAMMQSALTRLSVERGSRFAAPKAKLKRWLGRA